MSSIVLACALSSQSHPSNKNCMMTSRISGYVPNNTMNAMFFTWRGHFYFNLQMSPNDKMDQLFYDRTNIK